MIFRQFKIVYFSFILLFMFFNLTLFCHAQESVEITEEITVEANSEEEPITKIVVTPPDICISGILFGDNPTAIVNGEILSVNDSIGGATIVRITSSYVGFEYQGLSFQKTEGEGCEDKSTLPKHRKDFSDPGKKAKKGFNLGQIDFRDFGQQRSLDDLEKEAEKSATLFLLVFLFFGIPSYIYFSITLQRVAKKTNNSPVWLAWIPGANIFLMCIIAQRTLVWAIFILFLPVTLIGAIPAFIMMFMVFMEISQVCGKSKWLALLNLPIVPLGSYIYWGVLAFSKISFDEEPEIKVERIPQDSELQSQSVFQPESNPQSESESQPPDRIAGNDEDPPIYEG